MCAAVVSRANETSRKGSKTKVEAGRANNKNVRAMEIKNEEQVRLYKIRINIPPGIIIRTYYSYH